MNLWLGVRCLVSLALRLGFQFEYWLIIIFKLSWRWYFYMVYFSVLNWIVILNFELSVLLGHIMQTIFCLVKMPYKLTPIQGFLICYIVLGLQQNTFLCFTAIVFFFILLYNLCTSESFLNFFFLHFTFSQTMVIS